MSIQAPLVKKAPRELAAIEKEYDTLEAEYRTLDPMIERVRVTRENLIALMAEKEAAMVAGTSKLAGRQYDDDKAIDEYLLAMLDGNQDPPPRDFDDATLNRLNSSAGPPDPHSATVKPPGYVEAVSVQTQSSWWKKALRASQRAEQIIERQSELIAEQRERENGPGEPRPYRYLQGGSISRVENGRLKIYQAHRLTVIHLDAWQAAAVVARGGVIEEVV